MGWIGSGRIEARIGLRMMPTFPRSPLSFRTAGFPSVRLEGWLSNGAFLGDQRLNITVAFLLLSARAERPPGELYARVTMR
jgi:hypothetical protein